MFVRVQSPGACAPHRNYNILMLTSPPLCPPLPVHHHHHGCRTKHRYKNFLGLNNPNDFMAAAAAMKAQGDFTSLRDDAQTIAAVRAEGMAADKVLAINSVEEGATAARWVWTAATFTKELVQQHSQLEP